MRALQPQACVRPAAAPARPRLAASAAASRPPRARRAARGARLAAGAAGGGSGGGADAARDLLLASCPVPKDQQPIFQLQQLLEDSDFDLARQPLPSFAARLARDFGIFFGALGLPVSCFTFNYQTEPAQCFLSAAAGSLFIVTVLVWRLYLGWDHVGARLQSAVVEYEETGWYDFQRFVKPPEMLARDRLAFAYQVRPAIARVKGVLLGLGGALATSVVLLALLPPPAAQSSNYAAPTGPQQAAPRRVPAEAVPYEERLAAYEPWALEDAPGVDGGDDAGPGSAQQQRASIMDHMRPPQ